MIFKHLTYFAVGAFIGYKFIAPRIRPVVTGNQSQPSDTATDPYGDVPWYKKHPWFKD